MVISATTVMVIMVIVVAIIFIVIIVVVTVRPDSTAETSGKKVLWVKAKSTLRRTCQ
jgi:hypothetical protein